MLEVSGPMNIEQVFNDHQDQLMTIPGVTGVGIGSKDGKPAIVVMVERLTPALTALVPRSLKGYPLVVEQSGKIVAH
jgi:hypothetical protein